MKLSKKILGLSLIPIFLLLLGSAISGKYVYRSNEVTKSYIVDYVSRQAKVYEILRNLGYGGGIHTFKNYVLRFKDTDKIKTIKSFNKSKSLVDEYLAIKRISEKEKKAMLEIRAVINKYLSKVSIVESMIKEGQSRIKIDKKVKVDDAKALEHLNNLQILFKKSKVQHLKKLNESNSNALNSLVILFSIAIFISIILSRTISRKILISIKKLIHISELIALRKKVNKEESMVVFSDDELKTLAEQMIKMGEELSGLFFKLKRANNSLENSNKELESFAYIASHDLQEPIKKISSYIDLIEMELEEDVNEDVKLYIDIVKNSSVSMIQLIRSLLNYSKVNKAELEIKALSLNEIISQSNKNIENIIENNEVRFEIGHLHTVNGNKELLESLFQNLILNSIKFKKQDRLVNIKITSEALDQDEIRVIVEDDGIGFDMKHIETVFRPFGRIHSKSEYPGTGIGLSMCKKIVELHKGNIEVESESNKGCKVSFTLKK